MLIHTHTGSQQLLGQCSGNQIYCVRGLLVMSDSVHTPQEKMSITHCS